MDRGKPNLHYLVQKKCCFDATAYSCSASLLSWELVCINIPFLFFIIATTYIKTHVRPPHTHTQLADKNHNSNLQYENFLQNSIPNINKTKDSDKC